jgi:hypothetical protein
MRQKELACFLGKHPAELESDFEIAEVIFNTLLKKAERPPVALRRA